MGFNMKRLGLYRGCISLFPITIELSGLVAYHTPLTMTYKSHGQGKTTLLRHIAAREMSCAQRGRAWIFIQAAVKTTFGQSLGILHKEQNNEDSLTDDDPQPCAFPNDLVANACSCVCQNGQEETPSWRLTRRRWLLI